MLPHALTAVGYTADGTRQSTRDTLNTDSRDKRLETGKAVVWDIDSDVPSTFPIAMGLTMVDLGSHKVCIRTHMHTLLNIHVPYTRATSLHV